MVILLEQGETHSFSHLKIISYFYLYAYMCVCAWVCMHDVHAWVCMHTCMHILEKAKGCQIPWK